MDAGKLAIGSIGTGLATFLMAAAGAWAGEHEPEPFEHSRLHFEQNATDGDVEVVFELTGGDAGLAKLTLLSPSGTPLASFGSADGNTQGIRSFKLETPEPADVAGLKDVYPEGVYTFEATTMDGEALLGQDYLSHALPPPGVIELPDAPSANGMRVHWKSVPRVVGYVVEIEQNDLDVSLNVKLPATATSFALPDGFLRPGLTYGVGLGTVSNEGNISFVETTFDTAGGN